MEGVDFHMKEVKKLTKKEYASRVHKGGVKEVRCQNQENSNNERHSSSKGKCPPLIFAPKQRREETHRSGGYA
eukprot:8127924-Ditylum_brightwellii.AAC.1